MIEMNMEAGKLLVNNIDVVILLASSPPDLGRTGLVVHYVGKYLFC